MVFQSYFIFELLSSDVEIPVDLSTAKHNFLNS